MTETITTARELGGTRLIVTNPERHTLRTSHLICLGDVTIGGRLYRNRWEWCDCAGMSHDNPSHAIVKIPA